MLRFEVVVRNVEDINRLKKEIEQLRQELTKKEQELARMNLYVGLGFEYLDMLRIAKDRLDELGQDTSFIKIR